MLPCVSCYCGMTLPAHSFPSLPWLGLAHEKRSKRKKKYGLKGKAAGPSRKGASTPTWVQATGERRNVRGEEGERGQLTTKAGTSSGDTRV